MNENQDQNFTPNQPSSDEAGFSNFDQIAKLNNGSGSTLGGTGFISLADASKQTGYHQDYLGFLCRSGKLKGFKIGRNWVTTKAGLEEFIKNYKNGINEVIDETGEKIRVHVEKAEKSDISEKSEKSENQNQSVASPSRIEVWDKFMGNQDNTGTGESALKDADKSARYNSTQMAADESATIIAQPLLPQPLHHLKKEVLESIEQRVKALGISVTEIENKVSEQDKQLLLEEKISDKEKEEKKQVLPVIFPFPVRGALHDKFVPSLEMQDAGISLPTDRPSNLSVALSKDKLKKLYSSFSNRGSNRKAVAMATALAVLGFLASVLVSNFSTQKQIADKQSETKIFYTRNQTASSTPSNQTVINNYGSQTVNQLLGLNQAQVYNLIDNRLNQYLAEGKFKGDPGAQGLQGPQGPAGLAGTGGGSVTYLDDRTIFSTTEFSSDSAIINNLSVNNLTVNQSATFNSNITVNGTTTTEHLVVGDLVDGNCVQAGPNGTLTTTSLPCGSGSGGSGATTTINGVLGPDFTF
ncbi:MAG TPA: helix-turn-helix domain-containing protein, partial [Candidatus Limnocylindria bacterium]|nr:helix-turn-helix domain-containing protein [Candidatus Limnocylindria bacterium]